MRPIIFWAYIQFSLILSAWGESEKAPPGTSSFTFVFDTTGSMNDDLIQVQDGARKILDTVLTQREKLIYNYVYVPFHDPKVGPVFSTTDSNAFQRHLNSVHVVGGGDCPEMTLSGIKLALETSLPASFIYVFTDARAKDYHLEDQILTLIQEKQSSVVFVMTGDCNDRSHPGFRTYEKIAAASFGQVFHLEKTDVNKVLNYVRHSITLKKIHILYEIRDRGGTSLRQIPVDNHLSELTLSLSGDKDDGDYLDISLIDPSGKKVDRAQFSSERGTIDLNNIKLIRIKEPKPGTWKVRTTSRLKHTLRIFGHGAIDFKYGFASRAVEKIDLTHPRPIAHQNTHLIINMTGLTPPGIAVECALVDYYGKELMTKPMVLNQNNPYLYHIGPFIPPKGLFFVRIRGVDDRSLDFQRIASTAISSVQAGGPRAYMAERSSALLYQSINLTCTVASRTEFILYWYKDGVEIAGPLFYPYSDTVVWTINEVALQDKGEYQCFVQSDYGNHSATTYLETKEPAPEISIIRNVSATVNSFAYLHCRTQSAEATITWLRGKGVLGTTERTRQFPNGTLLITNVIPTDAGAYQCIVQSPGGRVEGIAYLKVLELPKSSTYPKSLFFVKGQSFNISCIATGNPKPSIEWFFRGKPIKGDQYKYYITYKNDLIVQQASDSDSGMYECRANNIAGANSDASHALLAVPPKIRVTRDKQMIGRGDRVILECLVVEGNPKPKIRWYRSGREVPSYRYIVIDGGRLTIQGVQDSDGGPYTCIAENIAGKDVGNMNLDVGSMPTIVPTPETVRVNIDRPVTLQCRAIGHPIPKISWKRNNIPIEQFGYRFKTLPDGSLLIKNSKLEDQDRYTCTAKNTFGEQDETTMLMIIGLVSPVLGHVSPEEQFVEGQTLRLSCIVVLGTPKPTLKWYKDGVPIYDPSNIIIESGGSGLVIKNGSQKDEGRYTCVATSPAGNASLNVNVQIIKKPSAKILGPKEIVASAGDTIDIHCEINGKPQPKLIWSLDGKTLNNIPDDCEILPNNTLRLHEIAMESAGKYVCIASSTAGEDEDAVELNVLSPPVIAPGQISYNLVKGRQIALKCDVEGKPTPNITWYLNDQKFENGSVDRDGSLIIDDADETHRGQFKCVAENTVGSDERIVIVTVHTAPTIEGSGQVKTIITKLNESVILPCPARAFPPPTRIWSYEGDRVYPGFSHGSEIHIGGEGSLEIVSPQMYHAGKYTCHVSNLAGEDHIVYLLKVYEPPKILSDIPGTVDVVQGLILEIPCHAIGTPDPTIMWEKDGFQVISDENNQIDSFGTIRIDNAQLADSGKYRCIATNPAGKDIHDTIVVVQEPPTILATTLTDYTTVEDDQIELRCFSKGNPPPQITWIRRGNFITDETEGVHLTEDGTLIIDNVKNDDAGHYTCRASNAAGRTEKVVRLRVITAPSIMESRVPVLETVIIGQPFSLYCPVFSTPLPEITWFLDNRPLVEGDQNILLSDDKRRLHLIKSRTTDAGSYKCVARNPAGESSKVFEVEVLVPPNVDESKYKLKLIVFENNPAEIGCPVSGIPEPSISWLVNGELLKQGELTRGMIQAPGSSSIMIDSVQLYNQGIFTCVATSKAGSLDIDVQLVVLAPPRLGDDEEIITVVGKGVVLNCDVEQEGSKPSITWLMNGSQKYPKNAQSVLDGRRMYLSNIELSNEGIYQCIVRNTAGESRKNFKVAVLAPPHFKNKEYVAQQQVVTGASLTLDCSVGGNPPPIVRWLKDGLLIGEGAQASLSDRDQKLTVSHTSFANHRYTCLANNKVGSISREFLVQVIAPPQLDQSDDEVIEVVEGGTVTLECLISSPVGPLDIDWLKDGKPFLVDHVNTQISIDKTRLVMVNVKKNDEASYMCVARNNAGQASREFGVKVLVPPEITGKLLEDIVIIEGEPLEMECEFEADPIPKINWKKDGAIISEQLQLLNEKRMALIEKTNASAAGNYQCIVWNKAGRTEKVFNVRVIAKPELIGGTQTDIVEVLISEPVNLECPISSAIGIDLSWNKNEIPIVPGTENIQILSGGRYLLIPSAAPTDEATYSCIARNQAGQVQKNYKLMVLVPPSIVGSGGQQNVIENNSLILPCEVEGHPIPLISWTKDGQPVLTMNSIISLSEGQQLKIIRAAKEHRGSYLCSAENKVGKAEINFDVDVITRPSITPGSREIVEAIEGESTVFKCSISDLRFTGEITWLKDFQPIKIDSNKYILSQSDRKLHVARVEPKDEGSYSCRVKNDAGESRMDYKLVVLVPPEIRMLDKDKNRTVAVDKFITLSCPATGKPEPTIDWYKDGELLTPNNINEKIKSAKLEGNDLKISKIQVANSGRYTCEAKNKAGMAEQDVLLYVMTPPTIEWQGVPSELGGKLKSTITISCPSYGRPPPTVTWLKSGRPLQYTPNVYLSANGMKLHFLSLDKADVDKYTCIARSAAGEDKRDFTLKLLEAPIIEGPNIFRKSQVNEGRTSIINCPATGSPEPSLAWLKNGQPLILNDRHKLLSTGRQLQISETSVDDDARYTCIATNEIGIADLETHLFVISSPVIEGNATEVAEVIVNEPKDLNCDVIGTEPIDIEWLKAGQSIDFDGIRGGNTYLQVSSRGRRLHILSAQVSDSGRFTCIARNPAGDARKNYDLKVLVPPSINETASSHPLQTAIPGSPFIIYCEVEAIPQATIIWRLNDEIIEPKGDTPLFLHNNQTIMVNEADASLEGRYTCNAENKVGRASRDFLIKLTAPPVVDRGMQKMDVVAGDYVALTCKIVGGTGNLTVRWIVDDKPVDVGQLSPTVTVDERRIEIRNARLSDSGNYMCVVENEAGQTRKKFELAVLERPRFLDMTSLNPSIIVGRPLVLDCSVTGTPKPTITWTKNGELLNDTEILFLNDRQQLHIESAEEEDAGRYSCIAENKPGRVEKDLIVAVLKPPKMEDDYRLFELPENDALTLVCPINDLSVEIRWMKNNIPITTSSNLQLSTSGLKLHLMHGQVSDSGQYTCIARNDAGEDKSDMQVIILVPPKILGPSFRPIDSVLNQTVQIECKATGTPQPDINWSYDGRRIFPSEKIQIINNGTTLILNEIQTNQEGRYSCTVANKVGRAEADTFLHVIAPPHIITPSDELKVIEGQGQTIRCEVSGTPSPTVEWLKNGQKFDLAMTQRSSNLHYIHLREAQVEDAGRYTCVATNRAGEHRMTTNLHVLVPPMILEGDRILQVKENTSLVVDCHATGIPTPQIIWKRDGLLLNTTKGSRFILPSTKANDAGRFTCEARNEAGKASADFEIDVFVKPRFRDLISDIRVADGERARLECKVDGHPEPIITWLRGGRPIEDMKNFIFSPRGETLMILKAKRSDAGSYSCVAKNYAGESEANFIVTVLIKPHFEELIDQNPRVILNRDIILHCPVLGNPRPKIVWLMEGEPVIREKYSFVGDGDLKITSAEKNNAGRYSCHATNEAGALNTDYQLEVIGPPKFHRDGDATYEALVDSTITMDCAVDADPKPEVLWYRGDSPLYLSENIKISEDGQQITIRGIQIGDGGKYTCKAKNEAGSADIDLNLKVLVPPSIDKSNIIGNPLAISGRSIYLECPVSGIPQPTVTWSKDGQPIQIDHRLILDQDNQTFGIKSVRVSDEGRYVCFAENTGGSAEQEFKLEVLVPPELETTESQTFVKREKDSLTLWCPVKHQIDSSAAPEILWYKDGRPIDPKGSSNVKITSEGQRLQLLRTTLSDAGNYSCVALNRAGESSLDFHVEILSIPKIETSPHLIQPHVIVGSPITLWCKVSGHPFPTIKWLKDGKVQDVVNNSNLRILEDGQGLEIINAQAEHSGVWICEVQNNAGKTQLEIALDIWTPPTVRIQPEEAIKALDRSITLYCEATGNPQPTLVWSRERQTLFSSAEGARISMKGARLDIPRLRQSHVGEYVCTATNEAGSAEAVVNVDVLVPPVINRDNIEMNPRLPTSQTLTLICDASGKPTPTIKWYINDTSISSSNERTIIDEHGHYIQISNISLYDHGVYKCVASNIAGRDDLLYTVAIVQAPWITSGGTHQAIEGEMTRLICDAYGEPPPVITWQRNGIRVETGIRYVTEDNALKVIDTRSSDSGIYVCIATNEAGIAQQAFTLEVFVAPRIVTTSPNESVVPIQQPFSLKCGVRGYPPPEIIWIINDKPIDDETEGFSVAEDGTLFVERAVEKKTLHFQCIAKNDAGVDKKEYIVRTIGPPVVTKRGIKMINATEGDASLLICEVEGQIPEIYWYKDNTPLAIKSNMELSDDGTELKIHSSKLHDEGVYGCVAVNPAGNATQKLQLFVGVPPRITEKPKRVVVQSGQLAELWCEAVGIPKPHITWLKEDEALKQTALDDHSETQKSTAMFLNVSSEDAGVYTCKAENWAGTSYKDVDLVVLIPPTIIPERLNITVEEYDTAILPCNTSGIPEPVVSWVKMPNLDIISNADKYQIIGTSLAIRNVIAEDDGFYYCAAKSSAGQVTGSRQLIVNKPERDVKIVWVECDSHGTPVKTTFIPARGDVPEDDENLLPWKQDHQDLPINGTEGVLIRCLPGVREPRSVRLGEAPRIVVFPQSKVSEIGSIIKLTCDAIGSPPPTIHWEKNDKVLKGSVQSGTPSQLLLALDDIEDAGDYLCIATNFIGRMTAAARIDIKNGSITVNS